MDFAPAYIKVLHGLGSILSCLHSVLSTCCSSSSVMIQILLSQPKFCILYDVQRTSAANSTSSNLSENIDHLTLCLLKTAEWVVCQTVKT